MWCVVVRMLFPSPFTDAAKAAVILGSRLRRPRSSSPSFFHHPVDGGGSRRSERRVHSERERGRRRRRRVLGLGSGLGSFSFHRGLGRRGDEVELKVVVVVVFSRVASLVAAFIHSSRSIPSAAAARTGYALFRSLVIRSSRAVRSSSRMPSASARSFFQQFFHRASPSMARQACSWIVASLAKSFMRSKTNSTFTNGASSSSSSSFFFFSEPSVIFLAFEAIATTHPIPTSTMASSSSQASRQSKTALRWKRASRLSSSSSSLLLSLLSS
mmetsp:Transcript_21361/g.50838  ORF Transcript_21361/g.50838 Transcript_21361/m.50838 type:complete len:271 (+) Transcript_21361:865-1677(+)